MDIGEVDREEWTEEAADVAGEDEPACRMSYNSVSKSALFKLVLDNVLHLTDSRTASSHGDRGLVSVVLMLVAVEHVGVRHPSLCRGRRGHGGGKGERCLGSAETVHVLGRHSEMLVRDRDLTTGSFPSFFLSNCL